MSDDAPSTGGLFGHLLAGMMGNAPGGLGAIFKLAQDPGLAEQVQNAVKAVVETHFAIMRCEAKLDRLLSEQGIDPRQFGDVAAPVPPRITDGTGGHGEPHRPVDDGASGSAPRPRPRGHHHAHADGRSHVRR